MVNVWASELQFDVSAACLMTKNEVEVDHIVRKHEVRECNLETTTRNHTTDRNFPSSNKKEVVDCVASK